MVIWLRVSYKELCLLLQGVIMEKAHACINPSSWGMWEGSYYVPPCSLLALQGFQCSFCFTFTSGSLIPSIQTSFQLIRNISLNARLPCNCFTTVLCSLWTFMLLNFTFLSVSTWSRALTTNHFSLYVISRYCLEPDQKLNKGSRKNLMITGDIRSKRFTILIMI